MFTFRLPGLRALAASLTSLVTLAAFAVAQDAKAMKSPTFHGAKVNAGSVTCSHAKGQMTLTLSDDFVIPDTPAPHWQVVDSRGNAYLLNRLAIKDDKLNKTLAIPPYVHDVENGKTSCTFTEALLGETDLVCK